MRQSIEPHAAHACAWDACHLGQLAAGPACSGGRPWKHSPIPAVHLTASADAASPVQQSTLAKIADACFTYTAVSTYKLC